MTHRPTSRLTEAMRTAAIELREKFLAVARDEEFSEAQREEAMRQAARLTIALADGDAGYTSPGGSA